VLVLGYHGGMFAHKTIRVLTSFHTVFLNFHPCFRHVTSEISKGATVMIVRAIVLFTIIKRVLLLLVVLLTLFQAIYNNPEEAIVKVAEGNRLDET
jgi:hypothetical protein